jgi:hypothetical protein
MCRWEDNIKLDLTVEWQGRIYLAQDTDKWAGCCEHGNEPSGSTIRVEFLD